MKRNVAIFLNATFLLIAFSMNIFIGLTCAISINLGFNAIQCEGIEDTGCKASCHHDIKEAHHKSKGCSDNCCNNHVIRFSMVDKSLPQHFTGVNAALNTTLIPSFYNMDVLPTFNVLVNVKYFVRNHHPPIHDIRLSIRSFQI